MSKRILVFAALAIGLAVVAGCSSDVSKQMTTSTETQTKVMDTIASNPDMAGTMMDRLMASDTTQALVIDKVMANGNVMQGIMNMAAQDSLMHDHMMGMMKSMGTMTR
jgi:hypothetical protein